MVKRDLTEGSVAKNLIYFSLPYLLSYFLQTLYGTADLFIIGQFCEVADTTAVSVGGQVMHMLTVMIVGLAMGTTVTIGRFIGAKDKESSSRCIGNTVVIFSVLSIILTALLLIFTDEIATIMSTPKAALNGTTSYLTICFIGIPFITAYNVISSVFRGMGDSKSPMYFIAAACAINIALDYLFIGAFNMGPAGAALGTTLSQTASVIIALVAIIKKDTGIKIKKTDLKLDKKIMGSILNIGTPVAFQDGLIQISFIVITVIANRRGLSDAAAVGIVEKIIGLCFLVPSSMLSAVSALSAQNIGAHKPERAKKTLAYAILFAVGVGFAISVFAQLFPEKTVALFSDDSDVIRLGGQYFKSYAWDCMIAGVHFCFSGYFCALGKSGISFLHNIVAIVTARIPISYWASVSFSDTLYPMGAAAPLGSLISSVICVLAYIYLRKQEKSRL